MNKTEELRERIAAYLSGVYGGTTESNMPQAQLVLQACILAGLVFVLEEPKVPNERILTLWDSYTSDMEQLYQLLMDGKSELAAVLLQERKELHNGQSRDTLIDILEEEKKTEALNIS